MYVGPAHVTRKQAASFISNLSLQLTTAPGDDEAKRNLQDSDLRLVANVDPPLHRDRHRCWRPWRVLLERIPTRNMATRLYEQEWNLPRCWCRFGARRLRHGYLEVILHASGVARWDTCALQVQPHCVGAGAQGPIARSHCCRHGKRWTCTVGPCKDHRACRVRVSHRSYA